MRRYFFEIAGIRICTESEEEIIWNHQMQQFQIPDTGRYDFLCQIRELKEIIRTDGLKCLSDTPLLKVYEYDSYELRMHYLTGENLTMQCLYSDRTIKIEIQPHLKKTGYFYMIGMMLDKMLSYIEHYVFHCCFVNVNGNAVLFSGDSGAGKSTQGELWKEYEDAEIINGDRCVLGMEEGRLMAYGFPVCGSSDYCENRSFPVKAIVFVEKDQSNQIVPLKLAEAYRLVLRQLSINTWNPGQTEQAADFMLRAVSAVPVYRLNCTIHQEAVEKVKEVL